MIAVAQEPCLPILPSVAATKKTPGKTKPGKPRGRAGGRKPLPEGTARVFLASCRVAPATAEAIKSSGLKRGATLDFWAQEIARLKKLAGE